MITEQEYLDIYKVVGAAMEVFNALGRGMSEAIYQEALALEMKLKDMEVEREKPLHLYYKDVQLNKVYFADFYYNNIVIELKSVDDINSEHRAQLFNYMRVSKQDKGILLNFGEKKLRAERYIFDDETDGFILLTKHNYMQYIIRDKKDYDYYDNFFQENYVYYDNFFQEFF